MGPLRTALSHRRAPLFAALLALALLSPALGAGYLLDDYSFQLTLHPSTRAAGLGRAPWDLFNFEDGSHHELARARGIWPWWVSPRFRLAFLRPLSSSLHALEFQHLASAVWAQHAHSLLWYAALVLVVGALQRRILGAGVASGVAVLLYAIDDAHAFPALWITHRNALIAMTLGFGSLALWDRRARPRDGVRALPGIAGPALFALALAGGEAAFGALAWIASYALLFDPRDRRARLRDIAPYALITLAWFALYRGLGYGAAAGAFYVDPARQPAAFLAALIVRMPLLLVGQLGLPPADVWMQQPHRVQLLAALVAYPLLALLARWLYRSLRDHPAAPFLAAGTLSCLIPVCATAPSDRLLLASGFGAFSLLALAVTREGASRGPRALVIAVHVVIAATLLPLKVVIVQRVFGGIVARATESLPLGEGVAGHEVIALTAPDLLTPLYASAVHVATLGHPAPLALRTLSVHVAGELTARRVDERTLDVSLSQGFLHDPMSQMMRGDPMGFRVGEAITAGTLRATPLALTDDGRPLRVRFAFSRSLDDPALRWTRWEGVRFVPWTPPAVGATVRLPPIDLGRAMTGSPE